MSNVCLNNGKCFLTLDEYYCKCDSKYGGELCQNPCTIKCINGGSCFFDKNDIQKCECVEGNIYLIYKIKKIKLQFVVKKSNLPYRITKKKFNCFFKKKF